MKKAFIFGTGSTGRRILKEIEKEYEVEGVLDNDESKWGISIEGIDVIGNASALDGKEYDEVFVCSLPAMNTIKEQLVVAGVPEYKINTDSISTQVNARLNFLHDFASINRDYYKAYSIAEGGVYQGDFAKEINECFPDSTLYLFDTFEGFVNRDVFTERTEGLSNSSQGHIGNTSIEMVLSKLPNRNKVVVKKGYFPVTSKGLENEKFFFVNLDFDLYNPTLEGLRFFFPRLCTNGIILIHDFFNQGYRGIKKAVYDYQREAVEKFRIIPIGDHCSIGILK